MPSDHLSHIAWVLPFSVPKVGGGTRHLEVVGGWLAEHDWPIDVYCLAPPDETIGVSIHHRIRLHRFGDATSANGRQRGYREIVAAVLREAIKGTTVYLTVDVGNVPCMSSFLTLAHQLYSAAVPCIVRITSSGRATELAAMNPERVELLRDLRYVALNPGIAQELAAIGIPRSATHALPNAVNSSKAAEVREKYREPPSDQTRVFITACRFSAKKRLDRLVAATIAASSSANAPVELWLVGTDKFEPAPLALVECDRMQLGGVLVRTWSCRSLRELYELMCHASVYVSFSTQEGMSNALLEAMAVGLTVVVSNQPANKAVLPATPFGFLFEPGDSASEEAALAAALRTPPLDLRRMGESNAASVKRFDVSVIAPLYAEMFRAVAANAVRPG